MTFDRSLILHRKSRTVELLWLGRAHTDGDVFVFLPKEKVLVTEDTLHGWTPYMGDCVIAGHGDVMPGKQTFDLWEAILPRSAGPDRRIKLSVSDVLGVSELRILWTLAP